MKRTIALAAIVALAMSGLAAGAQTDAPAPEAADHDYVIVTLPSPATAQYEGGIPGLQRTKPQPGNKLDMDSPAFAAYQRHLENERAAFTQDLAAKAPQAEVVANYSLTLNGVALKLNGHTEAQVARAQGARRVVASALYRPTQNLSPGLIGADEVWGQLGGQEDAGAGISVGVIDTGIVDTHPFFGCKDGIEHDVFASGVAFDPSNLIVFDHGTHVAGTVGGCVFPGSEAEPVAVDGNLSGVAPGVTLHDYNVFPGFGAGFVAFDGSAFSHDIAAALEQAVSDGMDVVNMSLGGSVQGPHDLLAEASDATVAAGTVVVASAGNEGPGDSTVGSPGSAGDVIAVAATTNAHFGGVPVTIGANDPLAAAAGDFGPFGTATTGDLMRWNDGTAGTDDVACGDTPDKDVTGAIALISRGVCSFTTKVRAAEDAGAVGVIVYNNVAGPPTSMAHDGTEPKPEIVAVMIAQQDGLDLIDAGDFPLPTEIGGEAVEFAAEPDIVAGFSSRGPVPFTGIIKPDIAAPGVNVYSSVFDGQFAFFQGTSMSSPHIAGAAALLLSANGDWSPADVKSALVNTADRERFIHDGEGIELLARGGGIADLPEAITAASTLDPASISFGVFTGNKYVQGSVEVAITGASCSVDDVTQSDGPVDTDVSATIDGGTLTVDLDAGITAQAPSGDYAGDIVLDCGGDTLLAPWFVRIDRNAKP